MPAGRAAKLHPRSWSPSLSRHSSWGAHFGCRDPICCRSYFSLRASLGWTEWCGWLGQRLLFITFFLGICSVWRGLPFLPCLISSIGAFPFPQQKVCPHPRGQAKGVAGVAEHCLRLTSNLNLESYLLAATWNAGLAPILGRVGKWAHVPGKPGNCFLAPQLGEGTERRGWRTNVCLTHLWIVSTTKAFLKKNNRVKLYIFEWEPHRRTYCQKEKLHE